jgi:putative dimethyl sulfoxide reductase chaperone
MTDSKSAHAAPQVLKNASADTESFDIQEFTNLMSQRASSYAMLARFYRKEIDQAFLDDLAQIRFPANTGDKNVDEGYRLIATFLSNRWENTLTELAVDYTRCFIGHGIDAFSAAYPFESVYTSEKRLLMQEARDEVLAIYRSVGIEKDSSWKESEDHIALELEFMQILTNRITTCFENKDEEQAFTYLATQLNFMEDHLMSWVPMMTADLKRFAKTDLYRGLAFLTDGILETDFAFLQDIINLSEEDE